MNRRLIGVVTVMTLLFFVVVLAPMGTIASAASIKIAVVNLREALGDSNAGKAVMKKLDQKYSNKIESKMKGMKKIEDKISLRGKMLKENEKKALQEDYFKKRKDFDQLKKSIVKEERESSNKIVKELLVVARKIGQEEGYSIILEKGQNVIFSVDNIDITKKIIKRHNEEYKAE